MKRIFKDKKRAAAFLLGLSFIVAGASLAIPSLAWLAKAQTTAKLDGLEGEAHGSYFNGGDGSKDHPFEIDNARQLYYFNWLQDLGYFNELKNDGSNDINQTYFKLTSDINANGYTLPPAGTQEYPFVGNFDGNGKTINNVTITNDYDALTNPPVGAKEDSNGILKQAEIVGFFGVVGSTTDKDEVNEHSYDSSTLEIKNLGISGASIVSASSNTLVGLAAGYVNGTLSGVGVDASSIAVGENAAPIKSINDGRSISEYSLVGYATEKYRASTQVNDETMSMPQISNPNTEHGSTNWGGSVDMKQMYTDLQSERDNLTKDVYYVASETVDVDINGKEGEPYNIKESTSDQPARGSGSYKFRNGTRKDSDENVIASYGLIYRNTSSDKYIYIYGQPSTTPTSSGVKMTVNRNIYGYATAISKDGNYLCVSEDGALTNGTDLSTASGWKIPTDGESDYLSTTIGKKTYYLNLSGTSSLSLSTTASTVWTYDKTNGSIYYSDSNGAYYLDYSATSGWTINVDSGDSYYLVIKDTSSNVYVGYDSNKSSVQASGTPSKSNYAWSYSDNGYKPLDSSVYLGVSKGIIGNASVVLTSSTSGNWTSYGRFSLDGASSDGTGTGKMKASISRLFSSSDYYLCYSNSSFSATTTSSDGHTFEVSKVVEGGKKIGLSFGDATGADTIIKEKDSVERNAPYYMNQTYIPLAYSYDNETQKSGINGVSAMNTGYLVGGANYVNGTDYAGDIRIAEYYTLSKLSTAFNSSESSYSSANLQVLTRSTTKASDGTYSDNGWTRIKDSYNSENISNYSSNLSSSFSKTVDSSIFSRYTNARRNLQYTIFESYDNASKSTSTELYGLHFMNADISTDHLSEVGKAVVYDEAAEKTYQENLKKYMNKELSEKPSQTGSVYYNYEVPEDSIDFNLATDGYINFFGASYYVNDSASMTNSSFFSLHKIERDSNQKITSIKEIKKVYANLGEDKKTNPYVYSYDGSVPATSDSNHLIFDESWISTNLEKVNYCLYYFEIPVNKGEYALGSVSSKPGGYLLYLDIGTAAADYEAVTIKENTTSKIIKESYPKGVDFTSSFENLSSLSGGKSACVSVFAVAPARKIDYNYEGTTLTAGPVSGLKVVFQGDDVTVEGDGGDIESVVKSPITIAMERTTMQTFSPANYSLSISYSCTWTISGASSGDKIQLYFLSDSASWASNDTSIATVANGLVTVSGSGDFKITAEGAGQKQATADWKGPEQIPTVATFGELKLSLTGGSASVEYVYDEDAKTYKVTVHSDVEVTVKVLAIPSNSDYKITVNNTEVNSVNQTFTVSPN